MKKDRDVENARSKSYLYLPATLQVIRLRTSPMLVPLQSFLPNRVVDHFHEQHKAEHQDGYPEKQHPWLPQISQGFVHRLPESLMRLDKGSHQNTQCNQVDQGLIHLE